MNRKIDDALIAIADDAHFMHMGRVDMTDHIKARLRHFQAADQRGELDSFLRKEVQLPPEITMDYIAEYLRRTEPNGDFLAMLYLSRCAVRRQVNDICMSIARGTWDGSQLGELDPMSMYDVKTFADAQRAVSRFFVDINWLSVEGFAAGPPATTQERLRQPFEMSGYMSDERLAGIALASFGPLPSEHSTLARTSQET